ncbi:MAG: Ni/Fe hydrogenase subunit alpha, partial [Pseudomonadota bacterium]
LRELMHMGQFIQSHSMHFFELAGPDLLLGFDADPAIRNVVGVIQANPDLALKAIRLRAFGQEIIRKLGGKRIHPNHSIPGGVNAPLSVKDRDEILSQIDDMIEVVKTAITVGKGWYEGNMEVVNNFAVFPSAYMGLVDDQGGLQLYDGALRLVDRTGKKLEEFDPQNYLDYIGEHVEDWSYLKFPFYLKMGWPKGTYRVGPLARLNVADKINTPMANEEFNNFKSLGGGKPVEGTLWYHYARLIEDLYAIERAKEILLDPDVLSTDLMTDYAALTGQGVGCLEAPRGTLFHHYKTDPNGMLTKVNLIVATGHNNWAISNSVEMVAKTYVDGKKLTEGMLNRVEAAIRAYDPCLSCSTHAIGAMPMVIEMVEPDGTVVDRIARG